MSENPSEFGTGLRAHLGLEESLVGAPAEPAELPEPVAEASELPDVSEWELELEEPIRIAPLETLAVLEAQLIERERELTEREAKLAGRAGALLAATQALYDEVLGGGPAPQDDELAALRQRKTVA
jgi:hypothetical protein